MERIQQRIYLSRKSLNSIEFEYEVLEIPLSVGEETSFEMIILNHGEPTHVHFSLGDEIKDKVMVLQDKVYVIEKEKIAAIVKLPKSYAGAVAELGTGKIFLSTGYGATKKSFSVEIVEEKRQEKEKKQEKEERQETEKRERREEIKGKAEKTVTVSPEKLALLRRLAVSTIVAGLFLISVFVVFTVHSFVFALIASSLFIFIVIYNF